MVEVAEVAEAQDGNLLFTIVVLEFRPLAIKVSIPVEIVGSIIMLEATNV